MGSLCWSINRIAVIQRMVGSATERHVVKVNEVGAPQLCFLEYCVAAMAFCEPQIADDPVDLVWLHPDQLLEMEDSSGAITSSAAWPANEYLTGRRISYQI